MYRLSRRGWRAFSQGPRGRVLCSLEELKALRGQGLKFPLTEAPPGGSTVYAPGKQAARVRKTCRGEDATGFVFFCETTQQPRAYVNSCPHTEIELDFDDSDFFCDGFIRCKMHDAFFDPRTGICLQGPHWRAKHLHKRIGPLPSLRVAVHDDNVHLVDNELVGGCPTTLQQFENEEELEQHLDGQMKALNKVMDKRKKDLERMHHMLQMKTMERLKLDPVRRPARKNRSAATSPHSLTEKEVKD